MVVPRFSKDELTTLAKRYSYPREESFLLSHRARIQSAGCFDKALLIQLASWKSPRSAHHVEGNDDAFVIEVSGVALASTNERTRIEVLTLLDGVSWPTASVILHLFHFDPYPVLDFRALWSMGMDPPRVYTFDFWWHYVTSCRAVYREWNCEPRVLDRALWQYSKEHQPPR